MKKLIIPKRRTQELFNECAKLQMIYHDKKIILEGIKVNYAAEKVVDFNFEIESLDLASSACLVKGENGSGKSTFLHVLDSKIAYKGTVSLICENNAPRIFSFESIELPNIKIADFFKYYGLSKDKDTILRSFSIDIGTRKTIKSLSPSEKNRLKLVYLFFKEYDFIFVDELSHDLSVAEAVVALEVLISQKKDAMLLVIDHRMRENCGLFDHLLHFEKGRIVRDTPLTLDNPKGSKIAINPVAPSNRCIITAKHFIKSNLTFLSLIFFFMTIFSGAFLGSSLYINNRTDVVYPFIGLKSGYKTIDKNQLNNSDELYFFENLFLLFDQPFNFTPTSVDNRKLKLISSFDQFGSTIVEGHKPTKNKEIAITKDLKKFVKNGRISLYPAENGSKLDDMLVTGYLRGANSVSLNKYNFYQLSPNDSNADFKEKTSVTLDGTVLNYRDSAWSIDGSLTAPKILVNSSIYDEFITSNHTVILANSESGCRMTLENILIEKVDFSPSLPSIIVRFTYSEHLKLLQGPNSDSVTLIYEDYKSFKKDKDFLLKSGFPIYSMSLIEKNLQSLYLTLSLLTFVYIAFMMIMIKIGDKHKYITLSGQSRGGSVVNYFSILLAITILLTSLILLKFFIPAVLISLLCASGFLVCWYGFKRFRMKKYEIK